jgi:hypothetical protein
VVLSRNPTNQLKQIGWGEIILFIGKNYVLRDHHFFFNMTKRSHALTTHHQLQRGGDSNCPITDFLVTGLAK